MARRATKIVATLGPASSDPAMLEQLANPSSSVRLAPAKSRRSATPNG